MADAQTTANSFGYSLAFFNSDPELKSLLNQATSGNWTPDRFVAALRNTQWFRVNGESMRKYMALSSGDPGTLAAMRATMSAKVSTMMQQMGAEQQGLVDVTEAALKFGWDDTQIRKFLSEHLQVKNGQFYGQAGTVQAQIQQMVDDYGVDISQDTIGKWVRGSIQGVSTPEAIKQTISQIAQSKYIAFASRLQAGETMRQIADPYVQSMAKTLELNPESVGLNDNMIQQALQHKDDKGLPTAKTVWQFEQDLRNDPRWAKTQNAQDSAMQTANKVLSQFGLVSS